MNMVPVDQKEYERLLSSDLKPIPMPVFDANVPIHELDLMIMPGLGFDSHKNRIGYGMGIYDRFLNRYQDKFAKLPVLIGVAHDFQVFNDCLFPTESHDTPLDVLLTEKQTL